MPLSPPLRLLVVLRPYLTRLVPVGSVGAAVALGVAVATLSALAGRAGPGHVTLVALAAGAGAASLFDDRAASLLASSPTVLWRRRTVRLAAGLPAVAAGSALALWLLQSGSTGLTLGDGLLEAGAAVAAGLAVAAVSLHSAPDEPAGPVAVPALLALAVIGWTLPPPLAIYPVADHRPGWIAFAMAASVAARVASADALRRAPVLGRGSTWVARGSTAENGYSARR